MLTIVTMSRLLMQCLYALVGLLLAGTIAVFLRSASLWSSMMTFLVFLGMLLTFLLGVFVGADQSPRHKRRLTSRPPGATTA